MFNRHYPVPLCTIAILMLFAFVITKNAWVSDDAYITFRTIDNFINGYGLTWNIEHRVQSYTHPLWMFVNAAAYAVTGEIYFTTIFISILLSIAVLYILISKIAVSPTSGIIAVTILIFSQAFTDYSTSGLETPLTFLALVVFFWTYLRTDLEASHQIFYLSLIASLGMLNRLDTALLYGPALLFLFWTNRSLYLLKCSAFGFLPLILWEIFSIIYYGFPIPNTAYAKLNTGIPTLDLIQQGLHYYHDSFARDPITLVTITGSLVVPFLTKNKHILPVTIGLLFYLLYILKIGGDFMTGRFFATPLLLAAILIAQISLTSVKRVAPVLAIILILGLIAPNPPIFSTSIYGKDKTGPEYTYNANGIVDERAYYFQNTGLINAWKQGEPNHAFVHQGRWLRENQNQVTFPMTEGTVGLIAYYAGPNIHFSDVYALTDPLLSRLPLENQIPWRIGHFQRRMPNGYMQTLHTQKNQIRHPQLAQYYDQLQLITQGDFFTTERWSAIWHANMGGFAQLLAPQWDYMDRETQTRSLIQQQRQTEAIALMTEALKVDHSQANGWYLLAHSQYEANQLEKAYMSILNAVTLDGKNLDYRFLHIAIAYAFQADGHHDRGKRLFDEALKTAKVSEVHLKIGEALTQLGQTTWALQVFQDIVKQDMKTARFWYFPNLQAAHTFKKQQKSQAFTFIARILYDRGDKQKAIDSCVQALNLDPTNQMASQYLTQWRPPS